MDYRRKEQEQVQVYFDARDPNTPAKVDRVFQGLATGPILSKTLLFWGRELVIEKTSGRVAQCDFKALCQQPLSAADYLELVQAFDILVLTNVPKMHYAQRNEARRFITLIDAMYDNKIKLIASFEAQLGDLLSGEDHKGFQNADRLLFDDLKLSKQQVLFLI